MTHDTNRNLSFGQALDALKARTQRLPRATQRPTVGEIKIAVDPASPRGDYTAKAEYRVLADGRIRNVEAPTEGNAP